VIYSVTDKNSFDADSRVNTFVHVTNGSRPAATRNGILLCVNGTGILSRWLNNNIQSSGERFGYAKLNEIAAQAPIGSAGLVALPFGNGAERILKNKEIGASFHGLDFNQHHQAHLFRSAQEGIVFALKYGFDILEKMGSHSRVIRAGHANMFLSPLFREAFANTMGARLELYDTDGAKGAALGAGIGAGIYGSFAEAFNGLSMIDALEPEDGKRESYAGAFQHWREVLARNL
jgi:xylulokinase